MQDAWRAYLEVPLGPTEASQQVEDPAGPGTGHSAVDDAMRTLAVSASSAPAEQVPAYQAAHHTLREILASIDEE